MEDRVMQAGHIRRLFVDHPAMSRRVWERSVMALSDTQFTQAHPYSVGSVRNPCVHRCAQLLSLLHGPGAPAFAQDYALYIDAHAPRCPRTSRKNNHA
jgi:hypothetical protein